jgi:glycosyltransferase involved in cell wall biosynthesis
MTAVVVVVKTNEGARWILPQIEAILSRDAAVSVVIPTGPGRLAAALDELAAHQPKVTIVRSPFDFRFAPSLATFRGLRRFRALIRSIDADAALYHLYASALASRFALAGTRTRRVHMVAGPLYLESPFIRMFERLAVTWDHGVIAGSDYTAARYAELGVPAERLFTIPYGVDVGFFAPDVEAGHLPASGRFRVVMVAYVYAPKRLAHSGRGIKGHDVLLRAWRRFAARHDEAELHLVGGGFDEAGRRHRRDLLAEFDDLVRDGSVTWSESVDDVRDAYRIADLSVSPSLSENHGAALEAGSMGVPSIVSDAGGLPETVLPDSGWIVAAGSVEQLEEALECAHGEWRRGALPERGMLARAHVVRHFDRTTASDLVADVVLGGEPRAR